MSLFDEIRAGKALKKVPESEKKDRSTLDGMKKVASSSPATAPVGSSVESSTPSVPPVGLGGLFANGVPKLRPSGSRAPGSETGTRPTAVTPQPVFQPNPAAGIARAPTNRASTGPAPSVPPRGAAPPPPPPQQQQQQQQISIRAVPTPSAKPTSPAPRVGLPSMEDSVPRPANAKPKVIHINSRYSTSAGAPPGQPQPPPPPPPPPPAAPQQASTTTPYGGQYQRAHPPAPPPPPPAATTTESATTLASEFERRFRFLNEQQLPQPPLPYHGVRTYKSKQNRAVPHPPINMPNGPTYPQ